jgi:hypothetical protein
MPASSPDKQKFQQFVRSKVAETTQICVRKGVEMALGEPSLNLIVAGELIKLGSAFAIQLGADEDGIARLVRGCYDDAVSLARAMRSGSS